MAQQLELHTLTKIAPSTYQYMTRNEWIELTPGGALEVARRACIQLPGYMVKLDSVRRQGLWAILTITIDLDAKPDNN